MREWVIPPYTIKSIFTDKQSVYFFANIIRHRKDNIYEFKINTL